MDDDVRVTKKQRELFRKRMADPVEMEIAASIDS
jgi:hypothetical protein